MIYLGLDEKQLKEIFTNDGRNHSNVYLLLFSNDGIDLTIGLENIEQLKKFMFYLQHVNENNIELERIKSFIDPDKRKDE